MAKEYYILGSSFRYIVDPMELERLEGGYFYHRTKTNLLKSLTTHGKKCLKLNWRNK